MNAVMSAKEVLSQPSAWSHFVQVYQETEMLLDAIAHFLGHLVRGRLRSLSPLKIMLAMFMRDGKPDQALFVQSVDKIFEKRSQTYRHIRAF